SKETSVFFPALIFGVAWCLSSRADAAAAVRLRPAALAALPFVIVVAIYAALRVFVVRIPVQAPPQSMGLHEFATFVPQALLFYRRQCLLPWPLSPIHSFRSAPGSWDPWLWISPLALAAVIIIMRWKLWRRGGLDAVALLIFLLPVALAIWGARG